MSMNWSIHHVNLADILGFAEGSWVFPPPDQVGHISSDPAKLTLFPTATQSQGENSGLHLIQPEAEFARKNSLDHNPSIGGIPYSLTGTFAIPGMRHLYVYDPGMNLIEINEMIK